MKKITVLFFILLTMPLYSQWIFQNSGVEGSLNDVYCITEDFVIVVGNEGLILKTIDGGSNWVQKTSGTINNLTNVQFVNSNVGFILGENGAFLKTVDGGENWLLINYFEEPTSFALGLSCVNENVLYISTSNTFKKSINGGNTFETINAFVEKIQFINEQIGYTKSFDSLRKTSDGGNTWTNVLTSGYIFDFFFINESIGFVNDANGLSKTIDGGLTYNYLDSFGCNINKLFAPSANVVWGIPVGCLLNGSPCYSIKGEISDAAEYNRTNGNLIFINSIYFADPTKGYGVGQYGAIVKNITGLDDLGVNEIDKRKDIYIYPNPASENVSISFSKDPIEPYSVEITNCLGELIFSELYQPKKSAIINIESISKGVYFLSVFTNEKKNTQKIIIK